MTGPTFGIRLTIDSRPAGEGKTQYVRHIEDVIAADRRRVGEAHSATAQLAVAHQQRLRDQQAAGAELLRAEQARLDAMTQAQIRETEAFKKARSERIAALRAEAAAYQEKLRVEQQQPPRYTVGLSKPAEDAAILSAQRVEATVKALWIAHAASMKVALAEGALTARQVSEATARQVERTNAIVLQSIRRLRAEGGAQGGGLTQAQGVAGLTLANVLQPAGPSQQLRELEAVRNAIALKTRADERSIAVTYQAAQALERQRTAAGGTTAGIGRLNQSLQTVAFSLAGIPGPVGRVAASLGTLAIGGVVTAGVVAGIAAIGFVISKLREEAERARKPMEELHARARALEDAFREKQGLQLASDLANATQKARELEPEIDKLRKKVAEYNAEAARGGPLGSTAGTLAGRFSDDLAARIREQRQAQEDAKKFQDEIERRKEEERDREAKEQRRLAEARRREQATLKQAALELAVLQATNETRANGSIAAEAQLRQEMIEDQVRGMEHLTEADRIRYRIILQQKDLLDQLARAAETERDRQRQRETQLRAFLKEQAALVAQFNAQASAFGDRALGRAPALTGGPEVSYSTDDALKAVGKAAEAEADRIARETEERARRLQRLQRLLIEEAGQVFRTIFAGAGDDVRRFVGLLEQSITSVAQLVARARDAGLDFDLGEGFSGEGSARLNLTTGLQVGAGIGAGTGHPLLGLLGGGIGGLAAGGPLGAISGAVSGFVSGILGSSAKARAAAQAFQEAKVAFDRNLSDFAAIAHPRGLLGDSLAGLSGQLEQLQRDAAAAASAATGGGSYNPKLHGGRSQAEELALNAAQLQAELDAMNKAIAAGGSGRGARDYVASLLAIRKAYEDNVVAIKAQIALQRQQFQEDLAVRALRAQGQGAEAEALAFQQQQQREYADFFKLLGDPSKFSAFDQAEIANLEYVQSLEAVAFATAQAAAAAQKAADQQQQAFSIQERIFGNQARRATLGGDTAGAAASDLRAGQVRAEATAAQQLFEAQKLYDAGGLTLELFNQLTEVIRDDFNLTLAELQKGFDDAAAAILKYNARLQEDLGIRQLQYQATISGSEADRIAFEDLVRQTEHRRELEQAIADGATAATQAMIAQTHAMHDQAVAAERARAAEEERTRAIEATTRLMEDLKVRELRARGLDAAADEAALLYRQQEETRKARAAGESAATLAEIQRVQTLERAKADELRRQAQQKAYEDAITQNFGITSPSFADESRTSVNLAVGLSESTGGRMAGLMSSQLAVQLEMAGSLRQLVHLARFTTPAGSQVLTPEQIDEGQSNLQAAADRAVGFPPGN